MPFAINELTIAVMAGDLAAKIGLESGLRKGPEIILEIVVEIILRTRPGIRLRNGQGRE